MLFMSLFGQSNEKTGIPFIENGHGIDKPKWYVDSAVLAPEGESFFTLKGDLITQWQLSPIKKLDSFNTGSLCSDRDPWCQINISRDGKRIILFSTRKKEIELWSIENKKRIKTIKDNLVVGLSTKYGFLTLNEDSRLHLFDDNNLALLKDLTIKHNLWYYPRPFSAISADNILIINYHEDALFFDLDKLEVIDKLSNIKQQDRDKYASKFNAYLIDRYIKHRSQLILMPTLSATKPPHNIALYKDYSKYFFTKVFTDKSDKERYKYYYFYQFDDAWLLMSATKRYFTGSSNVQKYIKMKLKNSDVAPINEATFTKYNRKINLKD